MGRHLPSILLSIRVLASALVLVSLTDELTNALTWPLWRTVGGVAAHVCMLVCFWWPQIGALLALPIAAYCLYCGHYTWLVETTALAVFVTLVARRYRYCGVVAAVGFATAAASWARPPHYPDTFYITSVFTLVAAGLGVAVSYMLRTQHRMERRLAAEQRLSDLATQSHRDELASHLHDSIGHALAVSSMISARHSTTSDSQLAAAFRQIHETASAGATHLAEAVALLRGREANTPHIPDRPSEVAASMRQTLLECGFVAETRIDPQVDRLPQSARKLVGRFMVEATTNVLKHGLPGGGITFTGTASPSSYSVSMSNPVAPPRSNNHPRKGGGGLTTMRTAALAEDADIIWGTAGQRFVVTLSGTLDDLSDLFPGGWQGLEADR